MGVWMGGWMDGWLEIGDLRFAAWFRLLYFLYFAAVGFLQNSVAVEFLQFDPYEPFDTFQTISSKTL